MAKIDLSTITEPISDEQPCGPDLDMEFDMDFMNLVAELEGEIPSSFFKFSAAGFKFDEFYNRIGEFTERTRDIRLLVPLAKLRILQGDLSGCAEVIVAIAELLKTRWADVHPQPMDDDYSLRMGYLFTLDDLPNMVLPLHHVALIRNRRLGTITYRKWQCAQGEVSPREGEDTLDASSIISALSEAEDGDIAKVVADLEAVRDALATIRTISVENAGFDAAVSLDRLSPSVDSMLIMIAEATGQGEAAEAEAAEGAADGTGTVLGSVVLPPGAVSSRDEVREALHLAARYFALNEPSNPAQVLLREAEAAIDKGFYNLVADLMPSAASSSVFKVGTDPFFELSLPDIESRNPAPDYAAEVGDAAAESLESAGLDEDESVSEDVGDPEEPGDSDGDGGAESDGAGEAGGKVDDAASSDEASGDAETDADASAEADPGGEADGETAGEAAGETAEVEGEQDASSGEEAAEEEAAAEEVVEEEPEPVEPGPKFWANSRPEAVALMEKVVAYYKVAEPTSPIPLLLGRAIEMSSKSFMDLLDSVMPEGTLRTHRND